MNSKIYLVMFAVVTTTSFCIVGCSVKTNIPTPLPQPSSTAKPIQAAPSTQTTADGDSGNLPFDESKLLHEKVPPIPYGDDMRQSIYDEEREGLLRAATETDDKFPEGNNDPLLSDEQMKEKDQMWNDLVAKYDNAVTSKYRLTDLQMAIIDDEAKAKHWHDPYTSRVSW